MDERYNGCHYKARRVFLGEEFEVRLFDVDDVGIAVIVYQAGAAATPLSFSRVFSRVELQDASITRTLDGYVALTDSLELVEDAYFTGADAARAGQSELAAYQLSSSLPGIRFPDPIVSQQAATAYLTRCPVGLTTWNASRTPADTKILLDVVARGLTELCRQKPTGLTAVKWLGEWLLKNNPTQPSVHVSSEELAFVAEEVDRIILSSIDGCLKDEVYDELKVAQWVDTICETIMKGLGELRKPLKYIVSCMIMQKNGAGVHSAISCHWDTVTDGAHVVKWPSDKHKDVNRSMYCVITVGGLSF
ncbi:hypothetical protein ATCC90586_004006 [Pythium insidiosum]|nr:hypothetical protein ATCC90586_004006 [Pythium insidiosum]